MEKIYFPSVFTFKGRVNRMEFIISNVDCLFEHRTFKIGLQNMYMNNYIKFEEQLTLVNDF